ncbi:DNA-binding transcriptional regulator, MerR family [Pelagirhabdus alkalitolerans]|uniref:DNA-binding transcriptional regulator, MerR family n=1 Tax=Pelagirhabdus alkalitolerans TaxID=1612202 RepID=A0A1G6GNR4_9BACI|nr:MerR family DNA-binding transcriptional regulator [Pelagirhabdus alkalitolerans]SDB83395.1 DNA-binding transcriptional regulator, MerR family [Pelagirhabdus alkalitolerans]
MERFNQNLLTIGQLQQLTGTHIKSLRYYEKVGVLIPVYIDPDSRYRYYSLSQVHLVFVIQAAIELGIPLKTLNKFLSDEHSSINLNDFLDYGKKIAEEKIKLIETQFALMNDLRASLNLSKQLSNGAFRITESARTYYVSPFEGELNNQTAYAALGAFAKTITEAKGHYGLEVGMVYINSNNSISSYLFFDCLDSKPVSELPHLIINEQRYTINEGNLTDQQVKQFINEKHAQLTFKTEQIDEQLDLTNPTYHLKYTEGEANFKLILP